MNPAPLCTSNKVVRLENAYDIVKHWKFLLLAMEGLNDPRAANAGYNPESFFNMLVRVTALGDQGLVCLLTSKNDKYLGFGCGFTAETFDFVKCFYVWQAFSNGKCYTTLSELLGYCRSYARSIGHQVVKTSTPRMTKAADRLFTQTLGFTPESYTYTLNL